MSGKDDTFTRSQVQEMINTAVTSAVAALQAAAPKPTGTTAQLLAEQDKLERDRPALAKELAPKSYWHKSRTGSVMQLRVVASRDPEMPHGRIVGLDPYQFPAGYDRVKEDGGCAPVPRLLRGGKENPLWQRWAFGLRKTDINNLIGAPFDPSMANYKVEAAAAE